MARTKVTTKERVEPTANGDVETLEFLEHALRSMDTALADLRAADQMRSKVLDSIRNLVMVAGGGQGLTALGDQLRHLESLRAGDVRSAQTAEKEFVSREDAASILGVHYNTVRLHEKKGTLHGRWVIIDGQRKFRIPLSEVEALAELRAADAREDRVKTKK